MLLCVYIVCDLFVLGVGGACMCVVVTVCVCVCFVCFCRISFMGISLLAMFDYFCPIISFFTLCVYSVLGEETSYIPLFAAADIPGGVQSESLSFAGISYIIMFGYHSVHSCWWWLWFVRTILFWLHLVVFLLVLGLCN